MKRAGEEWRRPYGARDFEFIREGPDGTLWQAADGTTVRVAAAEQPRRQAGEADEPGRCRVSPLVSLLKAFWKAAL